MSKQPEITFNPQLNGHSPNTERRSPITEYRSANTEIMPFDLPGELNQQMTLDPTKDLQCGHVAEIIYHGDRPYYNLTRMQKRLEFEHSEDTIRDRLNELTDMEILKRERLNNGDVWWLNDPNTDWPKPPDAEIVPASDELTISEFLSLPENLLAVLGVFAAAGSGLIVWIGFLEIAGNLSLPFETGWIMAVGLSVIFASYVCILLAGVMWVLRKAIGPIPDDFSFRDLLE